MANRGTPSSRQLVLGDRSGVGQVRVDIEAFFELSFWLAEEVEDLVRMWQKRMPRRFPKQSPAQNSLRRQDFQRPR
ncbi:MAG: hypothetical protein EHM80_13715 [Nitrospiraceae bacterium]|nr:MAG: hypothetical protein EHM80_13715 [Nitrospiraceae bacterium]